MPCHEPKGSDPTLLTAAPKKTRSECPTGPSWLRTAAYGTLAAVVILRNAPVLGHDWVHFDDDINIFLNPNLTGGSLATVVWAWTDMTYIHRYIPAGWMMFDALFAAGGLEPFYFHAASLLLAVVNAGLLLSIALAWVEERGPTAPAGIGLATLAVALATGHPLLAETVGWASGLLYLASTCAALLAVRCALRRTQSSAGWHRLKAAALYATALLIYPIHLFLSVQLLLARLLLSSPEGRARTLRSALADAAWWVPVSVIVGLANLTAARDPAAGHPALPAWSDQDLVARIARGSETFTGYVCRLLWPGPTSFFYAENAGPAQPIWLLVGLAGAVVLLLGHPRTRALTCKLLLLAVLALAPFLGIVDPRQSACDRYALPVVCLGAVALAVGVTRPTRSTHWWAAAGLGLLAISWQPYQNALARWRDTNALQARVDDVCQRHPNLRLGFTRPALVAFLRGDETDATRRLERAEQIFGPAPAIAETRAEMARIRRNLAQRIPLVQAVPYAALHFEIATDHRRRRQIAAAEAHERAAAQLLRKRTDTSTAAKPESGDPLR